MKIKYFALLLFSNFFLISINGYHPDCPKIPEFISLDIENPFTKEGDRIYVNYKFKYNLYSRSYPGRIDHFKESNGSFKKPGAMIYDIYLDESFDQLDQLFKEFELKEYSRELKIQEENSCTIL